MGIRSATTTLASKADSTRTRRAGIIGQASRAGEKIRGRASAIPSRQEESREQNRRDSRAEKQTGDQRRDKEPETAKSRSISRERKYSNIHFYSWQMPSKTAKYHEISLNTYYARFI